MFFEQCKGQLQLIFHIRINFRKMFLSFDQQMDFHYLQFIYPCFSMFPVQFSGNSLVNSPQTEQLENSHESNQNGENTVNLTKEDLITAGYGSKKRPWTEQEDKQLVRLIQIQGIAWKQITKYLAARTEKMCYSRYRRITSQIKPFWTAQEDRKLSQLVNTFGEDWSSFVPQFYNRNQKQLKGRYVNHLQPNLKKEEWSVEEDLRIVELIRKHGKNWKTISKEIGNRTDIQIKNRYYGRFRLLIRKKTRKMKKMANLYALNQKQ